MWKHSKLGEFRYENGWLGSAGLKAFDAFTYDSTRGKRAGGGKRTLLIEAADVDDVPSKEAIALALAVIENQERLSEEITRALWRDFTGEGPDSGMWWHGNLNKVSERLEEFPGKPGPPAGTDQLRAILRLDAVLIEKPREAISAAFNPRTGKPIPLKRTIPARPALGRLAFHAAFEREHGVAMLTDGKGIVGIGYLMDAEPFKHADSASQEKGRTSR
jgi:hypothetical protein